MRGGDRYEWEDWFWREPLVFHCCWKQLFLFWPPPDPDFRRMAHFESLFSNPSVPFVGFLCAPTTTNKSLPTSFPAPQQSQGMAVWQRKDWNFTLWRKGFGGRSLLTMMALSTSYQLWIERGNWAAQQRLMGLLMFSKGTVWGCLSDGEHRQDHLAYVELLVLNRTPREGGEWGLQSHPCSASSKGPYWDCAGWERVEDSKTGTPSSQVHFRRPLLPRGILLL